MNARHGARRGRCSVAVAAGDHPAAAREAEARTLTFAALCEFYLADGVGYKKSTTLGDLGRLKTTSCRCWGLPVDRTTWAMWNACVAAGHTAAPLWQARPGGRGTAGQALAVLGAVISVAVTCGLRDARGEETAGAAHGTVSVGMRRPRACAR